MASIDVTVNLVGDSTATVLMPTLHRGLTCSIQAGSEGTAFTSPLPLPPQQPGFRDIHILTDGFYVMGDGSHYVNVESTTFQLDMGTLVRSPLGSLWRVETVAPQSDGSNIVQLSPFLGTPYSLRPEGNLALVLCPVLLQGDSSLTAELTGTFYLAVALQADASVAAGQTAATVALSGDSTVTATLSP